MEDFGLESEIQILVHMDMDGAVPNMLENNNQD